MKIPSKGWIFSGLAILSLTALTEGMQRAQGPAAFSEQQAQNVIQQYCVSRHNQRVKTANLELDSKDIAHLEKDVASWESVVRKV